jgi:hypothetical protein
VNKIRNLLIPILVFFTISCGTFPHLENEYDTLLLIPYEANISSLSTFGHYVLYIADLETRTTIERVKLDSSLGYATVRNLPEGSYYISRAEFQYRNGGGGGSANNFPIDFSNFKIRKGTLAFTPVIFQPTQFRKEGDLYISMKFIFDETGEYQTKLFNELSISYPEEIGSWRVKSFIGE